MSKPSIDYRREADDIVYFTATVVNDTDSPKIASFSQTRSHDIIPRTNDYYMYVTGIQIDRKAVALMDFDEFEYFVTITAGPMMQTVQLTFTNAGNKTFNINNFRLVYTYQQFLQSLNDALLQAHIGLVNPGNSPRMIFDPDTKLFTLTVDTDYIYPLNQIIFSSDLYYLFDGLPFEFLNNYTTNQNYSIRYDFYDPNFGVKQYPPSLFGNYYNVIQEHSSLCNFNNIEAVDIVSYSIPLNDRYLGDKRFAQTTEIFDIAVINSEDLIQYTCPIIKNYEPGYRLLDMKQDIPLRKIDYDVNIITKKGNEVPLILLPGQFVLVNFAFVKKSLYNNEYCGLLPFSNSMKTDVLGINACERHTGRIKEYYPLSNH